MTLISAVSSDRPRTRAQTRTRWLWATELIGVAAALALIAVVATWIGRPQLRVQAASGDLPRAMDGLGPLEHNEQGTYRWSGAEATLRLFGFEQRAPVIVHARLSARREPGQAPAQVSIAGALPAGPFPVQAGWRRYMAIVPVPARGDEVGLLILRSSTVTIPGDNRTLGFALDWIEARQEAHAPADHLPDAGRLAFLVGVGLLGYAALRRLLSVTTALPLALLFALAVGGGIAIAPGLVAWWLPNLWLSLLAGWLVLVLPPAVRVLRPLGRDYWRLAQAAGGALMLGAVLVLPLQRPWSSPLGWMLMLGGAVLLVAALPDQPLDDPYPISQRTVAIALALCTALALFLRLFELDQLPLGMWRDEARGGMHTLQILSDPSFRPVYLPVTVDIPALLFYLATVPIGLFGPHAWTIRLAPALAGALTPLALYFVARPLFGARVGLLAAGVLAVSAWHIALSRLAFAAALSPPLTLLALGLLWRALQPDEGRRGLVLAGLAGACTGLALYAYHPSRLTPLAVALLAGLILGKDRAAWRAAAPRLAVLAITAAVVAWPIVHYALTQPDDYYRRLGQTSLFGADSSVGRSPAALIEHNARLVLGMWNERGDGNGRHNLAEAPQLDPLTGVAFAVGLALALAQLRDRRSRWLLIWLGIMLIPGVLSVQAPHAIRNVETIPPTMILAGLGGIALVRRLGAGKEPTVRLGLRSVIGAAALIAIVALNVWRYFVVWPASPPAYAEFYVADTAIGELAQALAGAPELASSDYQIFIPAAPSDDDVLKYLTSDVEVGTFEGAYFSKPPGEHALLIAYGSQPAPARALALQALGLGAKQLGEGPRSPLDGLPEFVIYGHDDAAPAVARVLAGWNRP